MKPFHESEENTFNLKGVNPSACSQEFGATGQEINLFFANVSCFPAKLRKRITQR